MALPKLVPLKPEELDNEFLSLDLNVVVVENMDGAIAHIREHGTQHSDAILTCDMHNAARFVNEVDSAAVYVNALPVLPTAGSLGLAQKWRSARRNYMPAVRWGLKRLPPISG
ncbi:gamma-glutamyl phosphate reductase [Salmonella enterica subsp. enterica]|nr:gamma-glutamyl phosphate reductase [Salmonella enterica subsp. enterica]